MNYIVDTCPLRKFEGGLNLLHEADDDAGVTNYSDCSTREVDNSTQRLILHCFAIYDYGLLMKWSRTCKYGLSDCRIKK